MDNWRLWIAACVEASPCSLSGSSENREKIPQKDSQVHSVPLHASQGKYLWILWECWYSRQSFLNCPEPHFLKTSFQGFGLGRTLVARGRNRAWWPGGIWCCIWFRLSSTSKFPICSSLLCSSARRPSSWLLALVPSWWYKQDSEESCVSIM